MLAKRTSKNQLTLPKAIVQAVGEAEYYDVSTDNGRIVLTPVRLQQADAVRAKLAELALDEDDIRDAVQWARQRVGEPDADYHAKPAAKALKPAKRKP